VIDAGATSFPPHALRRADDAALRDVPARKPPETGRKAAPPRRDEGRGLGSPPLPPGPRRPRSVNGRLGSILGSAEIESTVSQPELR
jgi:hypothetical protein